MKKLVACAGYFLLTMWSVSAIAVVVVLLAAILKGFGVPFFVEIIDSLISSSGYNLPF